MPSDYYSGESVGTLTGIGETAAVVGVLITTNVVPVITVEIYAPFFILGACLVPLAIGSVWFFDGHIEQVKAESPKSECVVADDPTRFRYAPTEIKMKPVGYQVVNIRRLQRDFVNLEI